MLKFVTPFVIFVLLGCASKQQRIINTQCNYDGAYQKGYNDAQAGLEMDDHVDQICFGYDTKSIVRKAYREGYRSFAQCKLEQSSDPKGGTVTCP